MPTIIYPSPHAFPSGSGKGGALPHKSSAYPSRVFPSLSGSPPVKDGKPNGYPLGKRQKKGSPEKFRGIYFHKYQCYPRKGHIHC